MFIPVSTASPDAFIHYAEAGYLACYPQVRFCRADFHLAAFNEKGFEHYGIAAPSHLKQAVTKRRAEYLAGRYCCATLLAALEAPTAVPSGADRAPCWPAGFTGSLSHCAGQAIALVTRQEQGWPGIDIENFNGELMRESAGMMTQPEERARLRAAPLDYEVALLLAFSAKESLYKALYPQVKRFFGFESASITDIDAQRHRFRIMLNETLTPELRQGFSIEGQYQFDGNTMITLLLCERAKPA